MAEFGVVMAQAKRLCKAFVDCDDCPLLPLVDDNCHCPFNDMLDAGKVEAVIVKWAEEHPESRYPSWKEWQEKNFPNNSTDMCPRAFGVLSVENCLSVACDECVTSPIPADIAEKLGIKPVGCGDDA